MKKSLWFEYDIIRLFKIFRIIDRVVFCRFIFVIVVEGVFGVIVDFMDIVGVCFNGIFVDI